MAIIYGKNTAVDYAAGNLASFGKSYSRMGAAPLDMTEVWYDKAALEEYAAYRGVEQADGSYDTSSVTSYVGQRVVYVNETEKKVYNYSIQLDGTLKEIGASPIGDGKSIEVAANGTVSLKGIGSLVFEREVDVLGEDGQPTGEKTTEAIQYQPLMTAAGLVWVEPSKTTVEGLATLIEALTVRVTGLEGKVGKAAEGEKAATGLFKAIADEAARATAAEKVLDEAIKAIDFMDSDEVADAIEEGIKDLATKQYVDDELAKKVNVETYNTDKKALADEDAAIREIAEGVKARVDAFLDGTGTEAALDSLQELIAYIDEHDGADLTELFATVSTLEGKLENIDTTVVAYVTAAIDALKIGDYAKAADLTELAGKVTALEGKVDVAKVSEAIAAAEGRASTDAQGKADAALEAAKADAAELYATKAYVGTIPSNYTEKDVVSYINKKAEETLAAAQGGSSETAASVKQQLDNYKSENLAKFEKLEGIEAGAQVNVIEGVQVNGTDLAVSGKKVNIDLSTYALGTTVDGVKATAEQGVADAAEAKGIAEGAATKAAANESLISGLDTRLTAAEGVGNTNTGAIAGHETRLAAAETAITTINSTSLPAKADKSVVDGLSTTVGEHTTALNNLNTNTIPALQAAIDGKAASADLTAEINRATGKENELAGLIATISGDYLKAADKTSLENAIAAEAKIARAAEKKNADDIAAINTLLNTVDSEDSITSLKELAIWVEAHGSEASEMTKAIEKNAEDIAANTKKIGEVEASIPGALSAALADYKVKNVDGTTIQLSDAGVASVKAISTDLLVQGELELVLNGGSAN